MNRLNEIRTRYSFAGENLYVLIVLCIFSLIKWHLCLVLLLKRSTKGVCELSVRCDAYDMPYSYFFPLTLILICFSRTQSFSIAGYPGTRRWGTRTSITARGGRWAQNRSGWNQGRSRASLQFRLLNRRLPSKKKETLPRAKRRWNSQCNMSIWLWFGLWFGR